VQELVTVLEHFNRTQSLHNLGDPVVADTLPNAGAFANHEAKDCCCTESGLIYKQKNAMLGQVVPPYSMLPAAAASAAGQHVAATASSCSPILLKPCSAMQLSVEHLFTK
jgi:hypothetical protein